jgi:hypothetical protein
MKRISSVALDWRCASPEVGISSYMLNPVEFLGRFMFVGHTRNSRQVSGIVFAKAAERTEFCGPWRPFWRAYRKEVGPCLNSRCGSAFVIAYLCKLIRSLNDPPKWPSTAVELAVTGAWSGASRPARWLPC